MICLSLCWGGTSWITGEAASSGTRDHTTLRIAWAKSSKCLWVTGSSSRWIPVDCLINYPLSRRSALLIESSLSLLMWSSNPSWPSNVLSAGTSGVMVAQAHVLTSLPPCGGFLCDPNRQRQLVLVDFECVYDRHKTKMRTINLFLSGSGVPRLSKVYGLFRLFVEWMRIKMVVDMVGGSASGVESYQ